MSDDVRAARAESTEVMRRSLTRRMKVLDELTSGRMKIEYESKLAQSQKALEEEKVKQAESRRQFEAQLKPLDDVHTFRRALLNDPGAVEFVSGDLEWLRVVLLMYGGLAETHLATYFTQYSEIANLLQMPELRFFPSPLTTQIMS